MRTQSRGPWQLALAIGAILLISAISGCTPAASEPQDNPASVSRESTDSVTLQGKATHPAEYVGTWKMQAREATTKNVVTFQPDGNFAITTEYVVKDNRGQQTQKQNKKGTWSVRDSILEFQYPSTPAIRYQAQFTGKDRLTLVRQGVKKGEKIMYYRVKQ